jgi:general secretion pathway protein G
MNFHIYRTSFFGFTLIEILVTTTIVGLLSTVGIMGFQAVTRNGRDAVRKSDLEQIRSALEIYKSEYGLYPQNSSTCVPDQTTFNQNYISKYPGDPRDTLYKYCYTRLTTLTYSLCSHLENGIGTDNTCGGAANNCGASTSASCNYKVSNP